MRTGVRCAFVAPQAWHSVPRFDGTRKSDMGGDTRRGESGESLREQRLANALRANLKRRKTQARDRAAASAEAADGAGDKTAKETG